MLLTSDLLNRSERLFLSQWRTKFCEDNVMLSMASNAARGLREWQPELKEFIHVRRFYITIS